MKKKTPDIIRPEIVGRMRFAALDLAAGRSDPAHTVTVTELVRRLLQEEYERVHPGMQFPDENGEIIPI